jgi:hypothetical protein
MAREFHPPTLWKYEWRMLCAYFVNAGLTIAFEDYEAVRWYTAPMIPTRVMNAARPLNGARYHPDTTFAGLWLRKGNAIILTYADADDLRIVRHEMTHAIMQGGAHDAIHFRPEWGNYTGEQPI